MLTATKTAAPHVRRWSPKSAAIVPRSYQAECGHWLALPLIQQQPELLAPYGINARRPDKYGAAAKLTWRWNYGAIGGAARGVIEGRLP